MTRYESTQHYMRGELKVNLSRVSSQGVGAPPGSCGDMWEVSMTTWRL